MYQHLALSDNGFLFDTRTGNTFTLNKTATFLLKSLIGGTPDAQLAALLVERLMDGEMVEARFRSDTSLAEIAEKFGCTRQNVGNIEKKLKARLAVELKAVW